MVVNIVNWLIDILVVVVNGVMSIFPQTPFEFPTFEWGLFGKLLGLFFPVGDMVIHMAAILVSVGLYYAIRVILRWIKMIQ